MSYLFLPHSSQKKQYLFSPCVKGAPGIKTIGAMIPKMPASKHLEPRTNVIRETGKIPFKHEKLSPRSCPYITLKFFRGGYILWHKTSIIWDKCHRCLIQVITDKSRGNNSHGLKISRKVMEILNPITHTKKQCPPTHKKDKGQTRADQSHLGRSFFPKM